MYLNRKRMCVQTQIRTFQIHLGKKAKKKKKKEKQNGKKQQTHRPIGADYSLRFMLRPKCLKAYEYNIASVGSAGFQPLRRTFHCRCYTTACWPAHTHRERETCTNTRIDFEPMARCTMFATCSPTVILVCLHVAVFEP